MLDHDYGARFLLKRGRRPEGRDEPEREGFFFRHWAGIFLGILVVGALLCAYLNGVTEPCR